MRSARQRPDYDVIIVGGGPVGSALALGLRSSRHSVLLLDANSALQRHDPRTLALSYGSRLMLERCQLWSEIRPLTAIESVHISQRGGFGSAVLTAAEVHLPALGYVVPYASVLGALQSRLLNSALDVKVDTRVIDVTERPDGLAVAFEHDGGNDEARAALVVVADGGALAQQLARTEVREYAQSALVCNVTTSIAHKHVAFERFTPEGPLALLPADNEFAVVWSVAPERSSELCSASPDMFLKRLQQAFGMRAGKFLSVRGRAAFPISLRVASEPASDRMLLIGNAAQTLHPVAGQGLNLGLRDAWELAQRLCESADLIDARRVALAYRRSRQRDRRTTVRLTDAMVRVFSNSNLALQWVRGCGLTFLDCVPAAKYRFMQQMMFGALW